MFLDNIGALVQSVYKQELPRSSTLKSDSAEVGAIADLIDQQFPDSETEHVEQLPSNGFGTIRTAVARSVVKD